MLRNDRVIERSIDKGVEKAVAQQVQRLFDDAMVWRALEPVFTQFFYRHGVLIPKNQYGGLIGGTFMNTDGTEQSSHDTLLDAFTAALERVEENIKNG